MNNSNNGMVRFRSFINRIIVMMLLCTLFLPGLQARLRFIGPNPYYSFLTFPQDSQLFKSKASLAFLYYKNRGWMGHLDVPASSPAPQYIATQASLHENFYGTQVANASFSGKWLTPEILAVPAILDYKSIRIIPMVSGQLDFFNLNASGDAIAHGDENDFLIPFSSSLSQKNSEMSFGFVASTAIKSTPVGMIFNYKNMSEHHPSGHLKYNLNGNETSLNRFNWGWSTLVGCNSIFGTKTNIDAFWQDQYTHTRSSQMDFVIGADIKGNKHGFRFRQVTEFGDYYSYSSSLDKYVKDNWNAKTTKTMYRAYDMIKLMNISGAKLYLVGVLELDKVRERSVHDEVELLDSFKEDAYVVELLPVIHFDLDGGGFFRLGTSASFFWKGYKYQDIWGDQNVYIQSWPRFDWERSWERSSHGKSFSFINFTEANLELPVFQRWNLLVSMDLWSHQVYRKTNRYYGRNSKEDGVYNFHRSAERTNVLKESWFGGTFGLFFGRKLSLGLFMDLPVYYDKKFSTEIKGEEGNYFRGLSDAQPAIRTPIGFWAMIIWRW